MFLKVQMGVLLLLSLVWLFPFLCQVLTVPCCVCSCGKYMASLAQLHWAAVLWYHLC